HETTISRMASSKYLSCEWGIFPVTYFFTNAVGANQKSTGPEPLKDKNTSSKEENSSKSAQENQVISQEGVKYEIAELLKAHKDDKKALSDQKISDLLAEKGIKVARRTVAKYRSQLNINSSYER
nr:RNA polymerase sigma-54 factor [Treponema sp.]